MTEGAKNISASIHARLLNLARKQGIAFDLILVRYGIERLLYRLSISPYSSQFVLKGAMLFSLWSQHPHRSTRDLDLLGFGEIESFKKIFESICELSFDDDGLVFDSSSITVEEIKSLDEYIGTRVTFVAFLGKAKIPIQVDIGIGDVLVPQAQQVSYPTLLDHPAPCLTAYAMETVISEKLHAIVHHGMRNTRMKDYFDLYYLSQHFEFEGGLLKRAIVATFERRGTRVPKELPLGLTTTFSKDPGKETQWDAFTKRIVGSSERPTLDEVVETIAAFLSPILIEERVPLSWSPKGPWKG